MILSELMHARVLDAAGKRLGVVIDVRFVVDGAPGPLLSEARLYGFVVSPHGRASYWGYERRGTSSPALVAAVLSWLHRGTFLVEWGQVDRIDEDLTIHLAENFEALSPSLDGR